MQPSPALGTFLPLPWQKAWWWDHHPLARLVPLDLEQIGQACLEVTLGLAARPEALLRQGLALAYEVQALGLRTWARCLVAELDQGLEPEPGDRRFRDPDWRSNAYFRTVMEAYLIGTRWLCGLCDELTGVAPASRRRTRFLLQQWSDALCPANFPHTNPEVVRETLATCGTNFGRGLQNLLHDCRRGEISIATEDQFRPGRDLALTEGQVVHCNALAELIQYAPKTELTYPVPLLILPPWINKYYVVDIRPGQSLVEHLVASGFTVFLLSWRNPDGAFADTTLDDYLRLGPLEALGAIRSITGAPEADLAGYCIGGTLLAVTLAYLGARGENLARSGTFFTALQDFAEVGDTAHFISEEQLAEIERRMADKGYLDALELSAVFRLMRANDLIWTHFVRNYLLGRAPEAADLMYWSVDGTRLPRAMHGYYLRNMYLENNLVKAKRLRVLGEAIDLADVRCPCYAVAALRDHITPWRSVHRAQSLFSGPTRRVLAESGHITGVVNPPGSGRGAYFTNDCEDAADPDAWLAGATRHSGSWWPDWVRWLTGQATEKRPAPPLGNAQYPPLVRAPGSYVLER